MKPRFNLTAIMIVGISIVSPLTENLNQISYSPRDLANLMTRQFMSQVVEIEMHHLQDMSGRTNDLLPNQVNEQWIKIPVKNDQNLKKRTSSPLIQLENIKTRLEQNKHQHKLTEFDSCTEKHRWAEQEPHNEKPYPGNETKELS